MVFHQLQQAVSELTNGRVAGALGMRAEHVKEWHQGVQWEEELEGQGTPDDGDNWHLFVQLVQAA